MDLHSTELLLFGAVFIVGLGATGFYYFARYYFKTDETDREVIQGRAVDISKVLTDDGLAETPLREPEPAPLEKPRPELKVVVPEPLTPPAVEAPEPPRSVEAALRNTKANIWGRLKEAFSRHKGLSQDQMESLEEILYTSDLGPTTVQRLLEAIEENLPRSEREDVDRVRSALKSEMIRIFSSLESEVSGIEDPVVTLARRQPSPQVWMIVGVNGAGKTTTIGKLAYRAARDGLRVMVVAGDTFRAAAGDQLKVWSERAQVEIFSPAGVKDPSAVAFDGCSTAKARGYDLVIVDTAGRLHTQDNLMEELKKMKRVIQKVIPEAPHEIFIVLDANSGQNALVQAKTFHETLGLSGAILTKLDGSAKGGVAVGLACELSLPIALIGVGEGIEDLRPFDSREFVESIL